MEDNKEGQEEIVESEQTENGDGENAPADRPVKNWQAEQARKDAEIQRLRLEMASRQQEQPAKRDQNDISTWSDLELKALMKDPRPDLASYKDQAEDILFDRRASRLLEKQRTNDKKQAAETELLSEFPDAVDPTSMLSVKMQQVMNQYDLQKSPAGRLAAAKIASAELGKGRSKDTAKERKAEADRVARVKNQMVDGDRSKSSEGASPNKKTEEIEKKIKSASLLDASGISEALKERGMDRKSFFGR